MPIYSYKCKDCGKEFDYLMLDKKDYLILSKKDKKKLKCQNCGSKNLVRLLSVFGVGRDSNRHKFTIPT